MVLELGENPYVVLISWLVLYAVAQVGLIALLATILLPFGRRRGVRRRQPTLVNLLVITLLTTFVNSILFYSGDMLNKWVPLPVCLVQMVFKRGTVAMFLAAVLCVAIEAWRGVQLALSNSHKNRRAETVILLALPWVAFCIFSLIFAVRGIQEPNRVFRINRLYYCSFQDDILGYIVAGYLSLTVLASLVFAIWTSVSVVRVARFVGTNALKRLNLSVLIRIAIVIVILFITFILNIVTATTRTHPWFLAFVEAATPLLIVLVFGLQLDILRAWAFWRHTPLADEEWGNIKSNDDDTVNLTGSSASTSSTSPA